MSQFEYPAHYAYAEGNNYSHYSAYHAPPMNYEDVSTHANYNGGYNNNGFYYAPSYTSAYPHQAPNNFYNSTQYQIDTNHNHLYSTYNNSQRNAHNGLPTIKDESSALITTTNPCRSTMSKKKEEGEESEKSRALFNSPQTRALPKLMDEYLLNHKTAAPSKPNCDLILEQILRSYCMDFWRYSFSFEQYTYD